MRTSVRLTGLLAGAVLASGAVVEPLPVEAAPPEQVLTSSVVDPLRQPDLQVRGRNGHWQGQGRWPDHGVVHRSDRFDQVGDKRRYAARVVNAGFEGERYRLIARPRGGGWSVRYRHGGRNITGKLVDGMRTPRLIPGQSWALTVVVRRQAHAADGTERLVWVRARSVVDVTRHDRIAVELRAR